MNQCRFDLLFAVLT